MEGGVAFTGTNYNKSLENKGEEVAFYRRKAGRGSGLFFNLVLLL
jgi:hypothetical protein